MIITIATKNRDWEKDGLENKFTPSGNVQFDKGRPYDTFAILASVLMSHQLEVVIENHIIP